MNLSFFIILYFISHKTITFNSLLFLLHLIVVYYILFEVPKKLFKSYKLTVIYLKWFIFYKFLDCNSTKSQEILYNKKNCHGSCLFAKKLKPLCIINTFFVFKSGIEFVFNFSIEHATIL